MIDLKSPEAFRIVLYFVVPGLVAVFFRAQFLSGRMQKHSDAILTYFSVSIVYWSMLTMAGISPATVSDNPFISFAVTLIGPMVVGCALGLNARLDVLRGLLRKIGLNPVHATATAWDWKLSRTTPRYVIVSLTDGVTVAGLYDQRSFSSSDPLDRDLFLEKVYEIPDQGLWEEVPGKEILIRAAEIKYIEFLPIINKE